MKAVAFFYWMGIAAMSGAGAEMNALSTGAAIFGLGCLGWACGLVLKNL